MAALLSALLSALLWGGVVADAVDGKAASHSELSHAEKNHLRLQRFWVLGDGYEGTASDHVEYVVWLIGVIGVLFYMANPNARQNWHQNQQAENQLEQVDSDDSDKRNKTDKKLE